MTKFICSYSRIFQAYSLLFASFDDRVQLEVCRAAPLKIHIRSTTLSTLIPKKGSNNSLSHWILPSFYPHATDGS